MSTHFRRLLPVAACLLLAACYDQPVAGNFGSTTPSLQPRASSNSLLGETDTPVRIGELGRSFAACNAQGTVNVRTAAEGMAVRAAPFDQARGTGLLAAGATFFICTRSLDQRWMGIVYAPGGRADPACDVSRPVPSRRDYDGICESGWVASAQVRTTSGVGMPGGEGGAGRPATPAGEPSQTAAQPK